MANAKEHGFERSIQVYSTATATELPEKKLTVLALRLAVLEKSASGIGALGFVWATVVILGGFAITVEPADFWFVTSILVIEAARIFSRSHELEWRHHYSTPPWLSSLSNFQTRRPLDWALLGSSTISALLHWLQPLSAVACIALSISRLLRQDYGDVAKGDTDRRNRAAALNVFYSLALAEAALFLAERAYWEYEVTFGGLLEWVGSACNIDPMAVRRFFYDAYSRCVDGSVFDGVKMEMGSFAAELLATGSTHERLMGARVMARLAESGRHVAGGETAEKLVEMVAWEGEFQARLSAAEVVARMADGPRRSAATLARLEGTAPAVASLLREGMPELGLRILKGLARDSEGRRRVARTEGLLSAVLEFTVVDETALRTNSSFPESHLRVVKLALKVAKMLANSSGDTGRVLREEMSEMGFPTSNIRDILRYGEGHEKLQKVGIEILAILARDAEARRRIGTTGGVVKELLRIFLGKVGNRLRREAGEALVMLTLDGEGENCRRMLHLRVAGRLTAMLGDEVVGVVAAKVLRNLCPAAPTNQSVPFSFVEALTTSLKAIMEQESKALQEALLGVASKILPSMNEEEAREAFASVGIEECDLASKLMQILSDQSQPSIAFPRMRRFTVELAICMMRSSKSNVIFFKEHGLQDELWNILDTTSEFEMSKDSSCNSELSSSGSIVDDALELLSYDVLE